MGMLCFLSLRFFFTKKARIDAVAMLAPLAVLFAALMIYNWGAEPLAVLTFALSVFVLLTNVRSLFRLSARLYVDHYSRVFVTASSISVVIAVAIGVTAVIFRPARYRPADFSVAKTTYTLTGSFATGYKKRSELFERSTTTGVLYLYEKKEHEETLSEKRVRAFAEEAALKAEKAELAAAQEADTAAGGEGEGGATPAVLASAAAGATGAGTSLADSAAATVARATDANALAATNATVAAASVNDVASASASADTPASDVNPLDEAAPANASAAAPIILFMPKSTASVIHYEPYLLMLAQRGYRVLSADFYSATPRLYSSFGDLRLFRRVYSVLLSLFANERFSALRDDDVQLTILGYEALASLAIAEYGDDVQLFFAIDSISMEQLSVLSATYSQNVIGFFAINRIAEYKTSGYGFIEQSDPLLGTAFGVERDESFFIPRYVAGKTVASLQESLKLLHPIQIIRAQKTDDDGDAQ